MFMAAFQCCTFSPPLPLHTPAPGLPVLAPNETLHMRNYFESLPNCFNFCFKLFVRVGVRVCVCVRGCSCVCVCVCVPFRPHIVMYNGIICGLGAAWQPQPLLTRTTSNVTACCRLMRVNCPLVPSRSLALWVSLPPHTQAWQWGFLKPHVAQLLALP